MQIWFTGMDPRTKKGYQYEYWWNLNNVWSFANYVESILIYYFEKCIIVMTTSMENGYKISRDSVLYLQLFSICKLILKLEVCLVLLLFSHSVMSKSLQPMSDPWTVAHQGPLFTGLLRQEYWCGLPFPSPGHLPYHPFSNFLWPVQVPLTFKVHSSWKLVLSSDPPGLLLWPPQALGSWTTVFTFSHMPTFWYILFLSVYRIILMRLWTFQWKDCILFFWSFSRASTKRHYYLYIINAFWIKPDSY